MLPEAPIGITAFGAYVPAGRLQRQAILAANGWFNPGLKAHANGERSIAHWDEDPITMAVEATRDCLSDMRRASLTGILFASTTMPFADRQNSVIVKEAVTMEDLMISEEGRASYDVLNGVFDADGEIPCQIDGGLKCFGHPIGGSGLRMISENYLQLLGRAGPRQVREQPTLALSHNLGGMPSQNVSAVAIVGMLGT